MNDLHLKKESILSPKTFTAALALTVTLSACVTNPPIPPGYTGPTATVFDSSESIDGSRSKMFVLAEIDGAPIDQSVQASARASSGQGFSLTQVVLQRAIPARAMKVKLVGTYTYAAPIQKIAAQVSGSFVEMEAIVSFTPEPEGKYVVRGLLSKERSALWIENQATGQVVTQKVER